MAAGGGNCQTAANCNDSTKVCVNNTCGVCTSNNDCTAAYGTNHVCHNGSCIGGNCLAKGDCASSGLICGAQTAFTCGTCGGNNADADCVSEYGANHICNGGVCVGGTCHDSTGCGAGQVCDLTTHTCGGCGSGTAGDTACHGDAKYGATYICQNNACIVGNCHDAASCNDATKVCNNFTCGACGSTTDCTERVRRKPRLHRRLLRVGELQQLSGLRWQPAVHQPRLHGLHERVRRRRAMRR